MNFNEISGTGQPEIGTDGQRVSPQGHQAKRMVEQTGFWAKIMKQSKAMGKIIFGSEFLNNIKSIMFLSMILSMITPVLGSLTATYANETIILDYAIFVFVHLIYYDFDLINQKPEFTISPEAVEHQGSSPQTSQVQPVADNTTVLPANCSRKRTRRST